MVNTASPSQALYQLLNEQQPQQVLSCSRSDIPALAAYCQAHDCEFVHLDPADDGIDPKRYDLAVVADCLEHLDKARGTALLARLRNLHSHRIWVVVDETAGWQLTDFIALGFQRLQAFSDESQAGEKTRCYCSYGYDINTYNHTRTWNNPRFWANPENFGKYWW
ncbi:hypothetical protein FKG94_04415 [Exilibacterium tricleocarpae]|uniref:Class I SAM-dependent methyltransferase n=1 Tax=Exilibacterium tricleocarpae TaxID=2591008 RepID=A0A545U5M5_9GAMM|nr:DUF6231 family protein [Exilibacterium tricleocarpae]TQV84770.1 hypothetical protein FKG94_04415 [Exilibacterium tricleocarpae]